MLKSSKKAQPIFQVVDFAAIYHPEQIYGDREEEPLPFMRKKLLLHSDSTLCFHLQLDVERLGSSYSNITSTEPGVFPVETKAHQNNGNNTSV